MLLLSSLNVNQGASQPSDPGDMVLRIVRQLLVWPRMFSIIPRQDNLSFLASDTLVPGHQLLGPAGHPPQPRLQPQSAHQHQPQGFYEPNQFQVFQHLLHMGLVQDLSQGLYNIPPPVPHGTVTLTGGFVLDAAASDAPPQGEASIEPHLYTSNDTMMAPYPQVSASSELFNPTASYFGLDMAGTEEGSINDGIGSGSSSGPDPFLGYSYWGGAPEEGYTRAAEQGDGSTGANGAGTSPAVIVQAVNRSSERKLGAVTVVHPFYFFFLSFWKPREKRDKR